jgi:hypothetical protein
MHEPKLSASSPLLLSVSVPFLFFKQVLEVANDLGLDPRNAAAIRERLVRQGVQNIKRVSVSDASSY